MTEAPKRAALELQRKLRDRFLGAGGSVAEELYGLQASERQAGATLSLEYRGFTVVLDCFQALVLRTLSHHVESKRVDDILPLATFIAAFRTFRASYLIFWAGYQFEAAGMLRTVSDNVCLLGALEAGVIQRIDLAGDNKGGLDRAKAYQFSKTSGLDPNDLEELRDLNELLGMHIHGSKIVATKIVLRAIEKHELPSAHPYVDVLDASHYGQVSVAVAWSLHRVLWTLQDRPQTAEWIADWGLLESAFREYVADWNRPASGALSRWINLQLGFGPR